MRHIPVLLGSLLLVSGCVVTQPKPAPDNMRGKDFVAPQAGALIVVLPPAGSSMPKAAAGSKQAQRQLATQLKSAGYQVVTLAQQDHDDIWTQEVSAAGGLYDPHSGAYRAKAHDTAISNLAQRVCAELKCAMVMRSRLVERRAILLGTTAEWDGQRQPIPMTHNHSLDYKITGQSTVISVELLAIMADGQVGFRTYGGTAQLFQANVQKSRNEPRPDLFEDEQEVASGVRIALEPLTGGRATQVE